MALMITHLVTTNVKKGVVLAFENLGFELSFGFCHLEFR